MAAVLPDLIYVDVLNVRCAVPDLIELLLRLRISVGGFALFEIILYAVAVNRDGNGFCDGFSDIFILLRGKILIQEEADGRRCKNTNDHDAADDQGKLFLKGQAPYVNSVRRFEFFFCHGLLAPVGEL